MIDVTKKDFQVLKPCDANEWVGRHIGVGLLAIAQAIDNMAKASQDAIDWSKQLYEEQKGNL